MQSQIESEIQSLSAEKIESEQTQKTNLEEKSHHKHHVSKERISYIHILYIIAAALHVHHVVCLRMFTNYVLTL